ncbi:glycerol-3-phosphate responsive antiterminator [Mesobacillus harenae]|uniref:glycerol-3-phosphate responsive antiterminator n=1 Tax=Mesobacillus harenae TaxID=2213203 RepID=UPI00157FE689|nr:glycerol-3-phosphate responsive antiterminator [Mesobacillus harenae]
MNIVDMVESQMIASIKNEKDIDMAIKSSSNIAFLLTGNLINIEDHIRRLRSANMHIFVHLDFIDGISNTKSAVSYIAKVWKPTGIITTKSNLIKFAKEEGLMAVQRIFLIDFGAVQKGIEMAKSCKPDAVEVLPGLMPQIIDKLTKEIHLPLIAGGLISERADVLAALESGALAVSSGNPSMWNLNL